MWGPGWRVGVGGGGGGDDAPNMFFMKGETISLCVSLCLSLSLSLSVSLCLSVSGKFVLNLSYFTLLLLCSYVVKFLFCF